jgi:hypothetical protein
MQEELISIKAKLEILRTQLNNLAVQIAMLEDDIDELIRPTEQKYLVPPAASDRTQDSDVDLSPNLVL